MTRPHDVWAVVVGGGSGQRFGAAKQFEALGGERIIDRSCRVAESVCTGVVVVVPAADVDRERTMHAGHAGPAAHAGPAGAVLTVAGGDTRSASVRAGLDAVPDEAAVICVHDAARPLADAGVYERVIDAVRGGADGAVPAVPVSDTIKVVDGDGVVVATPDRATLVAVQTPQAFRADVLRAAHAAGGEATDDAALVEALGGRIITVPGDPRNRKITDRSDLEWANEQVEVVP